MAVDARGGGGFAVVVVRDEGRWEVGRLPDRLVDDLDGVVAALRQQPGSGNAIALIDVEDEFFVVVRLAGEQVRVLLSDVTAADEWDLAQQALEHLGIDVPDDDHDELDDVSPAGDVSIFTDLGVDELELSALLSDVDAYADEILFAVAGRLGFADELVRVVDAGAR